MRTLTQSRKAVVKTLPAFAVILAAITAADEIGEPTKSEILQQLQELSMRALNPADTREKPGVIKALLTSIGHAPTSAASVAQIWTTWGPRISSFFGV